MDELYDVIVIGAGPAGNTAALYTARANLRTLVLDRPGAGGMLASTEHIANFPGVPGPIPGRELLARMRQQAESFGAEYRAETVISLQFDTPRTVYTNEGGLYHTRGLIIATGALERKTKLPGEEEFLGRGVSTCAACDAPFYREKTVMVAGNDDFAAEECLAVARFAAQVYLATPTTHPRITSPLLTEVTKHPRIAVRAGWRLREIIGDDRVRAVRVQTTAGEETLAVDGVFVLLGGARPTTGFLQGQLPLSDDGAILTTPDGATSIPGVYAVGDVTANHVKQAVVAAGEACVAALALEKALRGRPKLRVDYS